MTGKAKTGAPDAPRCRFCTCELPYRFGRPRDICRKKDCQRAAAAERQRRRRAQMKDGPA